MRDKQWGNKWARDWGNSDGNQRQPSFIIRFFHLPKYTFDNASAKLSLRGQCDVNSGHWFCFRACGGISDTERICSLLARWRWDERTSHYSVCQSLSINNSSCREGNISYTFSQPRFSQWGWRFKQTPISCLQLLFARVQGVWSSKSEYDTTCRVKSGSCQAHYNGGKIPQFFCNVPDWYWFAFISVFYENQWVDSWKTDN